MTENFLIGYIPIVKVTNFEKKTVEEVLYKIKKNKIFIYSNFMGDIDLLTLDMSNIKNIYQKKVGNEQRPVFQVRIQESREESLALNFEDLDNSTAFINALLTIYHDYHFNSNKLKQL